MWEHKNGVVWGGFWALWGNAKKIRQVLSFQFLQTQCVPLPSVGDGNEFTSDYSLELATAICLYGRKTKTKAMFCRVPLACLVWLALVIEQFDHVTLLNPPRKNRLRRLTKVGFEISVSLISRLHSPRSHHHYSTIQIMRLLKARLYWDKCKQDFSFQIKAPKEYQAKWQSKQPGFRLKTDKLTEQNRDSPWMDLWTSNHLTSNSEARNR